MTADDWTLRVVFLCSIMWVLHSLRCISRGEYSKWNVLFYLRVLGTMAKGGVRDRMHFFFFFAVQTNKSHDLIKPAAVRGQSQHCHLLRG